MAKTKTSKKSAAGKQTAAKRPAAKKAAPKKASSKNAAPKKASSKNAAPKKAAPKKAAPKLTLPKPAPPTKGAAGSRGAASRPGLKSAAKAAVKSVAKRVSKVAAKAVLAVKNAAKRVVPKRSASYGTSVDDFSKKLPEWQQQVVAELVRLIKAASPTATSMVKWGQPVFDLNGPFAFIKPAKAHVTFGFWRGAELSDPQGILEGAGDRMKHLKIAKGDAIPVSLLERLVGEAVGLNDALGDPTKRDKQSRRV